MAKAKISPRSTKKIGSSHIVKKSDLSNAGPKGGTPFYKASKKPVLLQAPESQVQIKIKALKHK